MVRERKLQGGVSNLSSRSNMSLQESTDSFNEFDKPTITKFYRSPSHKLISPDIYQVPSDNTYVRSIANIATWKRANVLQRDFSTTHKTSFKDPNKIPKKKHDPMNISFTDQDAAITTRQLQDEALRKFCSATKKTYGTIGEMLKLFKKRQGDDISLYEVNEYMRRQKISPTDVSEQEIKMIFDSINDKHKGVVPVESFMKKTEEEEYNYNSQKREMLKVADLLSHHVNKTGFDVQQSHLSEIDKIKKMKSLENESELFRIALGSRPFDHDLHHEHFDDVIDSALDSHHKHAITSDQNQHARMLNHGNVRLDSIPFYEMRSKELDASKTRAAMIHQRVTSDEIQGRLQELSKVRWLSSLSCCSVINKEKEDTSPPLLSQSLPNLPSLQSDDNDNNEKNKNNSFKPRNLLLDSNNKGTVMMEETMKRSSVQKKNKKQMLFQRDDDKEEEGDHNNNHHEDEDISFQYSKQKNLKELSDNSDLGGQDGGGHYHINTEDRRFLSTNMKFYPPIVYEASKQPQRDIVSDADVDFRKREYKRQQRYARTQANLNVTRIRLEYDQLDKEARDLNTLSQKMDDRIRYQTSILLEDLKNYKQVPFARAAKRPNIILSDKMFGGQLDRNTTGVVIDNRDFLTTYNSSFLSSSSSSSLLS